MFLTGHCSEAICSPVPIVTTHLLTLPHLSMMHTWKCMCVIEFRFVYNSPNRTMVFLSCLKEKGNTCVAVVLHSQMKTFHASFRPFNFQLGRAKFILVSANQCVCIESSVMHKDRACCPKYAITLSVSCPIIVFLNWGENGTGQFNSHGLFLIRPQAAWMVFFLSFLFKHTSIL